MPYIVTAVWTAMVGAEAEVREIAEAMIAPTRAEAGVLDYRAHQDLEDPRVFLFYEVYADEAAFQAHIASPHVEALARGRATPLLESRERRIWGRIESDSAIR